MADEKQSMPASLGPGELPSMMANEHQPNGVLGDKESPTGKTEEEENSDINEGKRKEKQGSIRDFIVRLITKPALSKHH